MNSKGSLLSAYAMLTAGMTNEAPYGYKSQGAKSSRHNSKKKKQMKKLSRQNRKRNR